MKSRLQNHKLTILGESSIGKTSIAYRLINEAYDPNHGSTIGAAFNCFRYKDIKIDMWDTAGQERYLALAPIYYRNSKIILLVFDISNPITIQRVYYYLDKIIDEIKNEYQCIIVGNKRDLVSDEEFAKVVQEVEETSAMYNKRLPRELDYIYLSAKDNMNITDLKNKLYIYCKEISHLDLISTICLNDKANLDLLDDYSYSNCCS